MYDGDGLEVEFVTGAGDTQAAGDAARGRRAPVDEGDLISVRRLRKTG
ncbi:MAG: hypothetical protein U0575_00765 [Phycisphaerales bacterium]